MFNKHYAILYQIGCAIPRQNMFKLNLTGVQKRKRKKSFPSCYLYAVIQYSWIWGHLPAINMLVEDIKLVLMSIVHNSGKHHVKPSNVLTHALGFRKRPIFVAWFPQNQC